MWIAWQRAVLRLMTRTAGTTQQDAHEAASQAGASNLLAIASNTPGLVYQFLLRDDGVQAFPYVSRACGSLLGISAARLRNDPALLLQLIEVARHHGAQTMFLEVRPSNLPARSLYDSLGFNEFSIRKGYYPGENGREDAILMGLSI